MDGAGTQGGSIGAGAPTVPWSVIGGPALSWPVIGGPQSLLVSGRGPHSLLVSDWGPHSLLASDQGQFLRAKLMHKFPSVGKKKPRLRLRCPIARAEEAVGWRPLCSMTFSLSLSLCVAPIERSPAQPSDGKAPWKFWPVCPPRVCICVLVTQSCLTLVTPWTVAHQTPLSMGFSRQEYWNGLPHPPPGHLPGPGVEPVSPAFQTDSLPSEQGSSG